MLGWAEGGAEVVSICVLYILKDGSSVGWDAEESFSLVIAVGSLEVFKGAIILFGSMVKREWC